MGSDHDFNFDKKWHLIMDYSAIQKANQGIVNFDHDCNFDPKREIVDFDHNQNKC